MAFMAALWCAVDSRGDVATCGEPAGPDIIMSDLNAVASFTPWNGIDSFSFGQVHCNLGDEPLPFAHNTNQHPVIGFNMYRLKDGRFEQIGMSWMFHSFFALSGNQCACGCTPTNGATLGVGCSSSDSAVIQAQELRLGPRSEVNPFTGEYPVPFGTGDPSSTGASVFKRLQVHVSDLDPGQNGGGQYFGELLVVAPGEAAAGNQNNNYSYRRLNITSTGNDFNASLAAGSPTVAQRPAISAWRAAYPEVVETVVQVPDDGQFVLAARVTYAGDGAWDYEYALLNQSSYRACSTFWVPHPEQTTVVNVGFHDVDYHSGEPFSGEDWTTQVDADGIRWYTSYFEEDENANALRWGTMYNFRFRTFRGPTMGNVDLELFRPGTPYLVQAATVVPANDPPDCNGNLIDDACDLSCGAGLDCAVPGCGMAADANANGVPDGCDLPGDIDGNGIVNLADFSAWGGCVTGPGGTTADPLCGLFGADEDEDVDLGDLAAFVTYFGAGM